ncbi:MAG: radical SAM protein [Coriobacteriales bacterium]|nr:radical SAM protein [Coriobacteriales bacterium]
MVKEELTDLGIKSVLKMLHSNPEKAIPRLLKIINMVGKKLFPSQLKIINEYMSGPDKNVYQLVMRALNQINPDVLDNVLMNFYFNVNVKGWAKQNELRAKYQCNIPWAILLDPTSACNLHCKGCWAADYGNRLNLSYEDIDSIIEQGKELGVYMYIYTGGEPLVRKDDLIKLCEKHDDCIFLCFTNATLIDEQFCQDLLRVKNFIPAISQEGSKETTDFRRSVGVSYSVYDKIEHGMNLLKEYGLPFGISCCYTSENYEAVSSPEYIDQLIDWGALFVWYFHYMPVGSDANIELMVTPEQREAMYHKVREYRVTKAIFPMDFQNDGQYVQGCIAGGRRYLHINANGDMDPCVFIHFSDTNIHEHTLLEGLQAPLFMAYHDGQPFNDNMLRPCPMLENPQALRDMIKRTGAHSSNLEGDETVELLCSRCDKYAKEWKPTADKLWEIDHAMGEFTH